MFNRKPKDPPPPQQRRAKTGQMTAQLPGMELMGGDLQGQLDAMVYGPDDDNENADLEQELLALIGGGSGGSSPVKRKTQPQPSAARGGGGGGSGGPAPKARGAMAQRAAQFDEGIGDDDDDDDEEFDPEKDQNLLEELTDILDDSPSHLSPTNNGPNRRVSPMPSPVPSPTPPSTAGSAVSPLEMLKERHENYQQALANAQKANEGSKVRRLKRGLKTLEDLIKVAKAGKPVPEDEIPPQVSLGLPKPAVETPPREDIENDFMESRDPLPSNIPIGNVPPNLPTQMPPMQAPPATAPIRVAPMPPSLPTTQHIPPSVSAPAPPAPPAGPTYNVFVQTELKQRRADYKAAALESKREGDLPRAGQFFKYMKEFDAVIAALESGQEIDLTHMPPLPKDLPRPEEAAAAAAAAAASEPAPPEGPPPTQQELAEMYGAPSEAPTSILEALVQRSEKYKQVADQAKAEGNSSKARRMGRICKQYEEAIAATKAKRPFEYDELPVPPGFPPLPSAAPPPRQRPTPQVPSLPQLAAAAGRNEAAAASAEAAAAAGSLEGDPVPQLPRQGEKERTPSTSGILPNARGPIKRQGTVTQVSRLEQQVIFLKKRHGQFKQAALDAKNSGDIDKAKEYVRSMKGLEPMIEASQNGYPVDISQVPVPPQHNKDAEGLEFEIVQHSDVEEAGGLDAKIGEGEDGNQQMTPKEREAVFHRLEEAVIHQIQACTRNTQHFQAIGDIRKVTEFEQHLAVNRKDLDALRNAFKHGEPPPKFHYESKTFQLVQCAPELGDTDLELTIIRGVDFKPPSGFETKDVDTYVKFEFPYPQEEPQKDKTATIKGTASPEYDQSFKIEINRKRSGQRVFTNKAVKFEVYYRAGFLKGDKLLATASIKLESLMTKFEVHDSMDLYDGRRPCGGRLEVKMRVREPIVGKQTEEVTEKWLVIDKFFGDPPKRVVNPAAGGVSLPAPDVFSVEVVKYEMRLIDEQLQSLRGKLTEEQEKALMTKKQQMQGKIEKRQSLLKQGGVSAYKTYLSQIVNLIPEMHGEARSLAAAGNRDKAKIMLTKKKIVEQEATALKSKLVGR